MSNATKAMNGGKWITIATVITTIFQFGQVTVLARLLSPADFGVVSISTLIINFFTIFSNLGFSNSIIYKQEADRRVLSTLYYLNLLAGALMFGLVWFSTPLFVSFYHEPKLVRVVRLASFYFLIVYFGQLYSFLLQKELRFRAVALADIVGTVIGSGVTIALAYRGYQELSLVIGSLTAQVLKTGLQIALGFSLFRPARVFDGRNLGDHLRFGLYNLGDGLIGFTQYNADNIFVGSILGVEMLGYYTIAYQLAVFPITKLNPIILQVAYPVLAKMKDDMAGLKRAYLKILDVLSYCNLPLLAGLYVTAESVVPLLYGPGWDKTIDLIRMFVFVGLFNCLSHPLFTLAFTKGKPSILFYLNLGTLVVKIPLLFALGTTWGLTGIALSFVLATLFNLLANFVIVHRLIGDFFGVFARNFAQPMLFCGLMMGVVTAYKQFVGYEGWANTLAEVVLGGLTYGALTLAYKLSLTEIRAYRQALL